MAKVQLTPEQYKEKLEKKVEKRKSFTVLFLKTIAICASIAVAFSVSTLAYTKVGLASLLGNKTSTPVNSQVQGGNNSVPSDNFGGDSTTPATPGDSTGTDSSNTNGQGASIGDQNTSATVMTSKTMQFDLFVKAFNGVKTNAKSATLVKKNAYNYEQHVNAKGNAVVESAGKGLMGRLLKEEEVNTTYTGADIAANFPPAGATSGLQKSDIQDISCKEEGNYYIITVVVKGAVNPSAGEKVGAVATILTKESIQDPIKSIPVLNRLEPKCDYKATTGVAKIEKDSGRLVEYNFDLPMYLYMDDYSIGLGFQEWWTVAY